MTIIGISGSPVPNSNTDRALRIALDATGEETEFIKLSDYTYQACRACLGCEDTNVCVLKDDATALAQKIRHADALIVAGYTPYASLDGRTKSFLERLWQLRHRHGYMRGKPGGIIITSAMPLENNATLSPAMEHAISSVANYMKTEGMEIVGSVGVVGNVPCIRCGPGEHCIMSGLKRRFGPDIVRSSVKIQNVEDQKNVVVALVAMGTEIGNRVRKSRCR
jgi:multimeric flavodoxin WrbA